MKKHSDLSDLLASVDASRQELHPHLDSQFLRRLVEIEHEAGPDDAMARKAIQKLVEAAVSAEVAKGKG
jgi:hypothetical protein